MNVGMLWFDNDPKKELSAKITGAANYYWMKYGKHPTHCFIHPSIGKEGQIDGIEIRTSRSVLPNHFWLGVE